MLKSFLFPLLSLLLVSGSLLAQEPSAEIQALFNPEITKADLDKRIQEGGDKIPHKTGLEAKLIWGLRNSEFKALEADLPALEKLVTSPNTSVPSMIRDTNELNAYLHFIKAQIALGKNDQAAFKTHITEAFWSHPAQSGLFAQPIVDARKADAMAKITVDLSTPLIDSDGKSTSLKDQLGSNKAILVDFWASWCGPCMQLMPNLAAKAEEYSAKGIAVVAMNTESDKAVAAKVKADKGMKLPWLVEPEGGPFSSLLQIDSIPRMILLTPEGKVLFNGHPEDPKLKTILGSL